MIVSEKKKGRAERARPSENTNLKSEHSGQKEYNAGGEQVRNKNSRQPDREQDSSGARNDSEIVRNRRRR